MNRFETCDVEVLAFLEAAALLFVGRSMWRPETDAQRYGSHLAGFNPDGRLNPHDVAHTGAGQFRYGQSKRFDPLSSSVPGGVFGGAPQENMLPRGNVEAIQRVKALPTGGGDFLDRLALAEARDSARDPISQVQQAAGARPRGASPRRPESAQSRASKILNAHQTVADGYAQQQQARQWNAMQKQGLGSSGLSDYKAGRDGGEGGAAAGAKSRGLRAQEHQFAAQAASMQSSWQHQAHSAAAQKRAEQMELAQQNAMAQQKRAQQEAIRQQQAQRAMALQQQSAMGMQQQQRQLMGQEREEIAMKTQWAKNQAARRNAGGIQFG